MGHTKLMFNKTGFNYLHKLKQNLNAHQLTIDFFFFLFLFAHLFDTHCVMYRIYEGYSSLASILILLSMLKD